MSFFVTEHSDIEILRQRFAGCVVTPDDRAYDDARAAWQTLFDQRPAAVALPADVDDVIDAVNYARHAGLRVAPQATGHNAPASAWSATIRCSCAPR